MHCLTAFMFAQLNLVISFLVVDFKLFANLIQEANEKAPQKEDYIDDLRLHFLSYKLFLMVIVL